MPNAVIYARKSTQSDGRQVQSLGDQEAACRRAAAEAGDRIVRIYKDAASGTDIEGRDGMLKLLADAANGRDFERVYVYDVERFSRGGVLEAAHCLHELDSCGVEVRFVAEGFRGDDTDELLFGVKGWLAGQFSRDLSRKTTRGMVTAFLDWIPIKGGGKATRIGRVPPWGYDLLHVSANGDPLRRVRYWPVPGPAYAARWRKEVLDLDGHRIALYEPDEVVPRGNREYTGWVLSLPERVESVAEIGRGYLAGLGYLKIARHIASLKLPSPSGKEWTTGTVQHILENEAYTGMLIWNKRSDAKFHRIERVGQDTYAPAKRAKKLPSVKGPAKSVKNPEEHVLRLEDAHPVIWSPDVWKQISAIRVRRSETRGGYAGSWGRRKHFYALSGLMDCGRCSKSWVGGVTTGGEPRYRCSGGASGSSCKTNALFKSRPIDDFVWAEIGRRVESLFKPEDLAKDLAKPAQEPAASNANLKSKETELQRLETKIARATDLLLDAPELDNALRSRIVTLEAEQKALQAEIARLHDAPTKVPEKPSGPTPEEVARLVKDFKRIVEHGTWDERRDFIRCFVDGATVQPEERVVEVRFYRLPTTVHSQARGWALSYTSRNLELVTRV